MSRGLTRSLGFAPFMHLFDELTQHLRQGFHDRFHVGRGLKVPDFLFHGLLNPFKSGNSGQGAGL